MTSTSTFVYLNTGHELSYANDSRKTIMARLILSHNHVKSKYEAPGKPNSKDTNSNFKISIGKGCTVQGIINILASYPKQKHTLNIKE